MKELFEHLKRIDLSDARNLKLVDTCFYIDLFEHPENLDEYNGLPDEAMTSFNVLELINVEHRLHKRKHLIRKFLKRNDMIIVDIDVEPGDREREMEFIESVDKEILEYCQDPSDAVLLAVAIKTHSSILTKDKHHLFNAAIENFLCKYNVKIYKELKDIV